MGVDSDSISDLDPDEPEELENETGPTPTKAARKFIVSNCK